MKGTEEEALEFAKNKAVREQRDIHVFERSEDHFYVIQPVELSEREEEPLETFRVEEISSEEAERILKEVEDHSELERGDQVIVGDDVEEIVRVTKILFETESGAKFLRSDGSGYGSEEREIVHKIKQTWT